MSISRGGRNLIILGIVSIVIAVIATSISLSVYHNSGDIYFDRSRPGFLPDETDESEDEEEYSFPDSGAISADEIETYLRYYKDAAARLDDPSDPFSSSAISDETLGIPE